MASGVARAMGISESDLQADRGESGNAVQPRASSRSGRSGGPAKPWNRRVVRTGPSCSISGSEKAMGRLSPAGPITRNATRWRTPPGCTSEKSSPGRRSLVAIVVPCGDRRPMPMDRWLIGVRHRRAICRPHAKRVGGRYCQARVTEHPPDRPVRRPALEHAVLRADGRSRGICEPEERRGGKCSGRERNPECNRLSVAQLIGCTRHPSDNLDWLHSNR